MIIIFIYFISVLISFFSIESSRDYVMQECYIAYGTDYEKVILLALQLLPYIPVLNTIIAVSYIFYSIKDKLNN